MFPVEQEWRWLTRKDGHRTRQVLRVCAICGKPFWALPKDVRRGQAIYCSLHCNGIATAKYLSHRGTSGPANPNWRGGISFNRARYKEIYRAWHLDAIRAGTAVSHALKVGKLIKEPCGVCGATQGVEAHHDDYDQPLVVRWLCGEHHRRLHVAMKLQAVTEGEISRDE